MANPEAPRSPSSTSVITSSVSRRQVLKGIAGLAGVAAAPSLLAACGAAASPSPSGGASSAPASSAPASSAPIGSITVGSNYPEQVSKDAMQAMADAFTKETGIEVKINTITRMAAQINSYLGGKPDDVFSWFSGYRMRVFAAQGLATPIDDVWARVGSNYSDAFKVGSTSDDGHQYLIPIYNYPWAVFYRKSLFQEKNYTIPTTLDELKTLATQMQKDGIIPIAFGDKDGWPAEGTFDILNLRQNGYDFHVGLMAGKEKWTDPRVKSVFQIWKDLLPFHQEGALGRTWQDASQALVQKKAGMYYFGMFVSEMFKASGQADLADLDFFAFPGFGTPYDAEKALDAPTDGFMISRNSPTIAQDLDAAKAFMEFLAKGSTQVIFVTADPSYIAAAKDADTSGYTPLQKKAVELIGSAQRIAQFMNRDTRPDFASANGMDSFLLDFLSNPDQNLDPFLGKIQGFWDSLT